MSHPAPTRRVVAVLAVVFGAGGLVWWGWWGHSSAASATRTFHLLLTADTNGYLQSYGCTSGQAGGLAKRATRIRQLRKDGVPTVFVDCGNLAVELPRAEVVVDTLRLMRCDAVGAGELELQLGKPFFELARSRNLPALCWPAAATVQAIASTIVKVGQLNVVAAPDRNPEASVELVGKWGGKGSRGAQWGVGDVGQHRHNVADQGKPRARALCRTSSRGSLLNQPGPAGERKRLRFLETTG
jgi:hypothetical protein